MSFDQGYSYLFHILNTEILPPAIQVMIALSPVVLAALLMVIFRGLWVDYVRAKNFLSIKYCVVEIKLPKDTFKSPLAMEVFLTALHNTSDGTPYAQYWKGETRPWYSLELISIGGQVKFMMWMEERRKTNLVSALYSQYPDAEVRDVEDYAKSVHFDPATMKMWAAEFKFTKPNPYPIKTYVDYGLDKDPKEEFKVDPLLPLLEFLGSVGSNSQVWIQIPIIAHRNDQKLPGHIFKRGDLWKEEANKLINEILVRDPKTKTAGGEPDPETGYTKLPILSKGEQEIVASLERRISKYSFDTGIRALYVAKKDEFNAAFAVGGVVGSIKQFGAEGFNGFKPNGDKWLQKFDYPWQDFMNIRKNRQSRLALAAYKRRSFFYEPFKSPVLVMNVEELATIYHFPGSVSRTPTLERLPSKKAQAPSNLPI
ncbi:MAG: hypothetical protein WCP09_03270 [Candidatus Taylorbacteria bacterium]